MDECNQLFHCPGNSLNAIICSPYKHKTTLHVQYLVTGQASTTSGWKSRRDKCINLKAKKQNPLIPRQIPFWLWVMHLADCYGFLQTLNDLKCSFQARESVFLVSMEAREKAISKGKGCGTSSKLLSAEKKKSVHEFYNMFLVKRCILIARRKHLNAWIR